MRPENSSCGQGATATNDKDPARNYYLPGESAPTVCEKRARAIQLEERNTTRVGRESVILLANRPNCLRQILLSIFGRGLVRVLGQLFHASSGDDRGCGRSRCGLFPLLVMIVAVALGDASLPNACSVQPAASLYDDPYDDGVIRSGALRLAVFRVNCASDTSPDWLIAPALLFIGTLALRRDIARPLIFIVTDHSRAPPAGAAVRQESVPRTLSPMTLLPTRLRRAHSVAPPSGLDRSREPRRPRAEPSARDGDGGARLPR